MSSDNTTSRKVLYGMFISPINDISINRFSAHLLNAVRIREPQYESIHIMIHSSGGFVGDGLAMHDIITSCPIPVHLHAIGSVQSIATILFLGAKIRTCSPHSLFMMHQTWIGTPQASTHKLKALSESVNLENKRTQALITQKLKLTSSELLSLKKGEDVWFTPKRALSSGLVQQITEFPTIDRWNFWDFTI